MVIKKKLLSLQPVIHKVKKNEKNVSALEEKKKKQAWVQIQDGILKWQSGIGKKEGKGQKEAIRFWWADSFKVVI